MTGIESVQVFPRARVAIENPLPVGPVLIGRDLAWAFANRTGSTCDIPISRWSGTLDIDIAEQGKLPSRPKSNDFSVNWLAVLEREHDAPFQMVVAMANHRQTLAVGTPAVDQHHVAAP